ncbi:type I methionyl aminopeptidase [Chitinophaga japonensis]|uniref:Methionine aminopeptidase n=1 Tax=Chitinophaga japonensis TaxID=104662 RepID=A0A562STM4_CHIJA|nr:type I methionyl aminopeptidase [Chitinophaga japonensis]TWI84438.1 methionine aminopeptidase, type I [Chitinophaga japonensis]
MSITAADELTGMQKASAAVALTLQEMRYYARPGMTTGELDRFGEKILAKFGARSAPRLTYNFPGCTCISLNKEIAHGIPHNGKVMQEGDLVNIDVSAELNGFWSDNGGSFVLGEDIHHYQPLVDASKDILKKAIFHIKNDVKISDIGYLMESTAKRSGYTVIRNLTGHGIGRSLHEAPTSIANYRQRFNRERFRKNAVVAVETFISTASNMAVSLQDGWTLVGNRGGYVAQHEHTIVVTDDTPIILTEMNGIWDEENI